MIDVRKTDAELVYDSLIFTFKKLESSVDAKFDIGVSISGGPTLVLCATRFIKPSMIFFELSDEGAPVFAYLHASQVNISVRLVARSDATTQRPPIGFQ